MIRHLRAWIAAAGIVCLIHAVHVDRDYATTAPRDLNTKDMWWADANARTLRLVLGRVQRAHRDFHAKRCTGQRSVQSHSKCINTVFTLQWSVVKFRTYRPLRAVASPDDITLERPPLLSELPCAAALQSMPLSMPAICQRNTCQDLTKPTLRDDSGFSRTTFANKRFSLVSKAFSSDPW